MKQSTIDNEGKIIYEKEIKIDLPKYVTEFDNEHPVFYIKAEEDKMLSEGCQADVSYLIDKYRFYIEYDYNLYLHSNLAAEFDRRHSTYDDIVMYHKYSFDTIQFLLSWAENKETRNYLSKIQHAESIREPRESKEPRESRESKEPREQKELKAFFEEELQTMTPLDIVNALINFSLSTRRSIKSLLWSTKNINEHEAILNLFIGLIRRTYNALNSWTIVNKNVPTEIWITIDILRPFVNLKVNTIIFENRSVIKELIHTLFITESLGNKCRSIVYGIVYMIDQYSNHEYGKLINFSGPTIVESKNYEDDKIYIFKLGFFRSDRYIFKLTASELVSLATEQLKDSAILQGVKNALIELDKKYLACIDSNGMSYEDNIKIMCATEMKNVYGFEKSDSWSKYLRKNLEGIGAISQFSPTRSMPQDCYRHILYMVYLKLHDTGRDFWNFDETTIIELLDVLRVNSSDDQRDFFLYFHKLNYIKSKCKSNDIFDIADNGEYSQNEIIPDVDWTINYGESATYEAMTRKVLTFIKPLLIDYESSKKEGFIVYPNHIVKNRENYVCSVSDFKERFKILLNNDYIRKTMMHNNPEKSFHCGFNAILLCNILGLLQDKKVMPFAPLRQNFKRMVEALFTNREIGKKEYRKYISKYDDEIDNENINSFSYLTTDMKEYIIQVFSHKLESQKK